MIQNPKWAPFALSKFFDPLMKNLRHQVPEFAGMKSGDRTLDICCGTGALALHYAKLDITAVGIDVDPRMIAISEKGRNNSGLGNATFQIASALNLPFADNLFDFASISMSLHENWNSDRDGIVSEMKRVVRKEGTLVFIDYKAPLPKTPTAYLSKTLEFIVGKDHRRCFLDYIAAGGLDELLARNHLHVEKRLDLGPLVMVKTPNG